jgi:hypothetical protein
MKRFKVWLVVGAVLASAALAAGVAIGDDGKKNDKSFEYAIGLWGDFPYSDVQALTGVPNLIADMNTTCLPSSHRSCRRIE